MAENWDLHSLFQNFRLMSGLYSRGIGWQLNILVQPNWFPPSSSEYPLYPYMGHFLQNGENGCFMSYFFNKFSIRVTKPDKIDLILQLILDICVLDIMKSLSVNLGQIFGVALDTLFLATLSNF